MKEYTITVKEFDNGTIEHFNENDHCIYTKYPNGNEYHYKYDENGNCIYEKYPNGKESFYKFDENNNCIYEKYPDGDEYHWKFDKNNNCIYSKWSNGNEYFYINNKPVTKEEWEKHYNNQNKIVISGKEYNLSNESVKALQQMLNDLS